MNKECASEKFSAEDISAIFSEVLGIDTVNKDDDFFKLGGDSFDAIRLMSKLGKAVRVVDIFENPTAEKLADYISAKQINMEVRLVQLNKQVNNENSIAFIGVPYGGGDPTIFRNLFNGNENIKVFGIDFGDSKVKNEIEFEELINKIINEVVKIDAKKVIIYGHCAGASTAACIASLLNEKIGSVKLVVAASKPIDDPDKAILDANKTSDHEWEQYLRTLGAFTGLNDDEVNGMMLRGRRDHFISVEGYRKLAKISSDKVSSLVIFGDADIATPNPKEIVEKWKNYIKIDKSKILSGLGHYFIRTHYNEISDIVLSFAED